MAPSIVIADDDAAIRQMVGVHLRGIAEVVGIAATWDDVLPIVTDKRPTVLLVDESMPGARNSLAERLEVLRAAAPATAVIVFSAGSDPTEAREAGAVSFLRKPVSMFDLRAAVLEASGRG